ncbi:MULTISPECIES: hypothetical protein [Paraburkholderia]|uniref:Uncharacterized protein n=2 Tax=Paraburkholderia TaxID=1822464 RepID=A0A7Y9WCT6_9BURK|nr:hypothetical protein [Paraburkholderia bryophila]NYH18494.1 hypothetical protein [Paraburkholderia bryophila]NYH22406.1 hypothetical protein [Paraburkholderia bryophila]
MTTQDRLLEKYRSQSVGPTGGEMYIESEVALRIPADCEDADAAIIGVETFTITPGSTYSHLDGIADYSPSVQRTWGEYRRRCNKSAHEFMQEMLVQKGRNTYFSFVIIDSSEYENEPG